MPHFVSDLETAADRGPARIRCQAARREFSIRCQDLIAIRHALQYPERWSALVLFDPPIYPRDGHPLRDAQQSDKDSLSARARRRTERYTSPR